MNSGIGNAVLAFFHWLDLARGTVIGVSKTMNFFGEMGAKFAITARNTDELATTTHLGKL